MHEPLHLSDNIETLYVSGNEGGRSLAGNGDCVNASAQNLEVYTKKVQRKITHCS